MAKVKYGNFKHKDFNLGEYVEFNGNIRRILGFDINDNYLNVALDYYDGSALIDSNCATHSKRKFLNMGACWESCEDIKKLTFKPLEIGEFVLIKNLWQLERLANCYHFFIGDDETPKYNYDYTFKAYKGKVLVEFLASGLAFSQYDETVKKHKFKDLYVIKEV